MNKALAIKTLSPNAPDTFGFIRAQDLNSQDMLLLYGLLKSENLLQVFFHDCEHISFNIFLAYAKNPEHWFYAVKRNGLMAGFMTLNNFSSSGTCAFLHACSFSNCRNQAAVAGMQKFLLWLARHSPLQSVVTLIPKPYRAARKLVEVCGFAHLTNLPNAMRIYRKNKSKNVDGYLFMRTFAKN